MPSHNKTTKKYGAGQGGGSELHGLWDFRKSLERDFFGASNISYRPDKDGVTTNLIVYINCNFGLTESLFHLNNGNWGGFSTENQEFAPFEKSIQELFDKNETPLEIVEFSINFKDTSLIISKIYPRSITDHLGAILQAINANFAHFTKGLTEMPFEIFVPVFMDQTCWEGTPMNSADKIQRLSKSYFEYWGLYFESNANEDAVIYDVKNKGTIEGDFFLIDY